MNKSDFDKNGIDEYGTHWLQYLALVFTVLAIYLTWAYFYIDSFHNLISKLLRFIDCTGFNPISKYCINILRN